MSIDARTVAVGRDARVPFVQRPLGELFGQLGVIVVVFIGTGAFGSVRPQLLIAELFCIVVAAIMLSPIGVVGRIRVSAPLAALIVWWLASYFWTANVYGWWTDTQLDIPSILTLVALTAIISRTAFFEALVAGCYLILGYTLLRLLVSPGTATVNPDGLPGWRGGFIHKNAMGPAMVLVVLVLMSFATPSARRTLAVLAALALTLLSQSTTALAGLLVAGLVYLFVRRLARSSAPAQASLVVGALLAVVVMALTSSYLIPRLLGLRGKDATLTSRTTIWAGVWDAIEQRPWTGFGIGGVWRNPAADPGLSINRGLGFTVFHSHNGYLDILIALGVVGLVIFSWLLVSALHGGFALLRLETHLGVFTICLVALMLAMSISENAFFGVWLALVAAVRSLRLGLDPPSPPTAST